MDLFYKNLKNRKTWNGFHIFAIDGSKFELPNSPSNFKNFGKLTGYPNENKKYSMALASVVYDVLEDYIAHVSIKHFYTS